MAERVHSSTSGTTAPRVQSFGTAAVSARNAFAWFWSRESLLRLALSFVLAVALWLYITEKQDPGLAQDFPQPLPIETINVANGLSVRTNFSSVKIRYRSDTPGALVGSVNFHPVVSLAGMKAGPPRVVPVQVIPDQGFHVVQVTPASVVVTIDRIETRTLQVTPEVLNNARKGYALGKIVLNPSFIQVKAAHAIVSRISGATVSINVANATATFDNTYPPVLQDSQGGPLKYAGTLQINPPEIQAHVPVTPLSSEKSLPVLVSLLGQVKAGYRIVSLTTSPEVVTAHGSPSVLSGMSAASTAGVRLSNKKTTFTTRVQLQLPPGVSTGVPSASVTIGIQPIKTK